MVSAIAAQPYVRQELVKQQQRWGLKGASSLKVATSAPTFSPDAELKIF
jgi:pantoate ligase/cytidylate kinase